MKYFNNSLARGLKILSAFSAERASFSVTGKLPGPFPRLSYAFERWMGIG